MEHKAWKGRIKPGCKAEYQRRHAEIWPEMVKVLKEAGICNYSIFYCKDELFGYYECGKRLAVGFLPRGKGAVPLGGGTVCRHILKRDNFHFCGAG